MARYLVVRVHLHDRFHGMAFGAPEWPPSPARLFQALIAGVAEGRSIPTGDAAAFRWLEGLAPPLVGAPRSSEGVPCALYVPNNDLDSVGGDPDRIGEIRTRKMVIPRLIEGEEPILFIWELGEEERDEEAVILRGTERLSHLGRGVDPAWALGEILDETELEDLLGSYPGRLFRPSGPGRPGEESLSCPVIGSFDSTERRVHAPRLTSFVERKKRQELFQNAPRPVFVPIRYQEGRELLCFDLVDREGAHGLPSFPLRKVARTVEAIRDAACARLTEAFPGEDVAQSVERLFRGKLPDGTLDRSTAARVRVIPLPSIGHEHADLQLRRIAVELPAGAEIRREDLVWAFEGLVPVDPETGEDAHCLLSKVRNSSQMLERYLKASKRFSSVTPVVLPEVAARRRIAPGRKREEAKGGAERSEEESRAQTAVRQALRHAGIHAKVQTIRVQREPLSRKGLKAELFAEGTRFAKERLWHVEIEFASKLPGPLIIGDGRFLGLGLMRPMDEGTTGHGYWAFRLDPAAPNLSTEALTRAFRRAVMARVGALSPRAGGRNLDAFFSGHDGAGGTDKKGEHLAFQWDPHSRWLMVIAPHRMYQREIHSHEARKLELLDRALAGFYSLRLEGGEDWSVEAVPRAGLEELGAPRRHFESAQPYTVNRHLQVGSAHQAIEVDVMAECERHGLPRPKVQVFKAKGGRKGLEGWIRLEFERAVSGPLLLGKTRFLGGGLLLPVSRDV